MSDLWAKYPIIVIIIGVLAIIGWITQFNEWADKNPKWKPFARFVKWSAIILSGIFVLIFSFITYSSWPEWLQKIPGYMLIGWFIYYIQSKLLEAYWRVVDLLKEISDKLSRIERASDRK